MKKITLLIILMAIFTFGTAYAGYWQVTVNNWTKSPGPNLKHENVLMDGAAIPAADLLGGKCSLILPADSNSCMFKVAERASQNIQIESVDTADLSAPLHVVGNLGSGIAPASGGSVGWTWISE